MEAPRAQREDPARLIDLAAAVSREPNSIPHRLELAIALLSANRREEAIQLFRDVALSYAEDNQLLQAIAVCRGILEIDPGHMETLGLLASFVERRTGRMARAVDATVTPPEGVAADDGVSDFDLSDDTQSGMAAEIWEGAPRVAVPLTETQDDDTWHGQEDARFETHEELSGVEGEAEPDHHVSGEEHGDADPGHDDNDEPTNPGIRLDQVEHAPADPVAEALLRSATFEVEDPITSIPSIPLLSDLPRAAFLDLLREVNVLELAPGQLVLKEGTVGDAFYLIAEGTVRVKKAGKELAVLGPGAFFGEFAVLADQRRHASVETIDAVRLLEVTRVLLDRLVAEHAGVSRTLRAFYADRLLATLVHTAPFFSALSPEERAEVVLRFRPRRFGRGATIIEEGASGGGLYLILVGEVEVFRSSATAQLARLGEGSYFGEMSLLSGGLASATVRATRLCETVQLPPRDFYEIVSRHPVLWDQLRVEATRRELTNVAILAGEARGDRESYLL